MKMNDETMDTITMVSQNPSMTSENVSVLSQQPSISTQKPKDSISKDTISVKEIKISEISQNPKNSQIEKSPQKEISIKKNSVSEKGMEIPVDIMPKASVKSMITGIEAIPTPIEHTKSKTRTITIGDPDVKDIFINGKQIKNILNSYILR
jgi:hypothetical protein